MADANDEPTPAERRERDHLLWLIQRMGEELRSRWTQIEGIHSRTISLMALVLGFAGFTVAAVKPLTFLWAGILVPAILVPAISAFAVLRPKLGSEIHPENLIDDNGDWLTVPNLAAHYRRVWDDRDRELHRKGQGLRRTYWVAVGGLATMLVVLALGGNRGRESQTADASEADRAGARKSAPAVPPASAPSSAPVAPGAAGEVKDGREGQGR